MSFFDYYNLDSIDPGTVNKEFSKVTVLKPAILSTWEYARALMPERSYKAPPGK